MRSYDLAAFSEMLRDPVRRGSYENALREQVCEGRSLLEIGGGTGYFACFSAKHGASSVVSCDPNPLILLGRQLASANDLDNVSFYSSPVEGIPKDTKFDVILHDMRGNLPMLSGTFEALRHARAHLAKPKCLWLPMRDTIWCALVEDPSVVKVKEPWVSGLGGLKLDSTIRGLQFRVRYQAGPKARHWGAWKLGEFDYASGNYAAIEKELTFSARRSGTSHGICFWFDSQLTNNIKISSSPWLPHSERANIYGVAGCLWEKPIVLNKGQAYLLQIRLSNEGLVSVQLKQDSALGQKRLLGKFDESSSPQHFLSSVPPYRSRPEGPDSESPKSSARTVHPLRSTNG